MAGSATTRQRDHGQVLVIFALSITVLFAAAGLAFDVGRFYSERRFLQNAADAAALAAANALIRGETTTQADARAREVLTANFARSPSGVAPALPPATPVYAAGYAGDPEHLVNGILITNSEIRVAVQNNVGYTFGRIVGLNESTIGGQARVTTNGNMLPVAVRRFVNLPGPTSGAVAPCPGNQTEFMDFFATANTSCLGSETDASLRAEPNAGAAFDSANPGSDPTNHGPVVAILGQGAQPNNGADFRGFIALDIRNFQAAGTQLYYNGVTASTSSTTLKAMEANWVTTGGYPGPQFPPATTPPDPNDQVATMSGNSTGIVIDEVMKRFVPGDEVLIAVYPGNVMAIPDFTMTQPSVVALPTTGTVAAAGSIKVSRNQAFSGVVTLSTLPDALDPNNPMVLGTLAGGATPVTYSPNPVTPSLGSGTTVYLQNMTTTAAAEGVYTLWIQGQAGSPYLTTKWEPMTIKVGTVNRDFSITADAAIQPAANVGDSVAFELELKRIGAAYGAGVSLSLDGPLPAGIGATSFSPSSLTPTASGAVSTLTINTGTMASGRYRFVVRASGLNGDSTPRPVTHLLQLWVDVATGDSSAQDYVDIVGFAVMRIASVDTNTVSAYAITPVIPDPNDWRLRRGQVARLVPWN